MRSTTEVSSPAQNPGAAATRKAQVAAELSLATTRALAGSCMQNNGASRSMSVPGLSSYFAKQERPLTGKKG